MNVNWVRLFNSKVSDLEYSDHWNIIKDDNLLPSRSPTGCNFYKTSSFARFHCSTCPNKWASAKALIIFSMKLQNGEGEVKVRFCKQQCRQNHAIEANFVEPVFDEENIKQVLNRLIAKIRQRCYHESIEKHTTWCESNVEVQGPHEKKHCEACKLGICTENS
ncbi:receptor-transporting protein 3-like isoform X1 [Hemiscyllium ocellatum]|uniref:receptor-transporting protein 3-like isoform X1 n=1 Tax=Hemiscyllium ocellatum TaxID=170820 RepID=UPI002966AD4B|nr:receptor-transporting protein 3-like isoform X1 [Hemiscyllium ocellatum]